MVVLVVQGVHVLSRHGAPRADIAAEPEVSCPLPPDTGGTRWDFGRPFERGIALGGRVPRCTRIGELRIRSGEVRLLDSATASVSLGRVPPGRYPVIRATTTDASFAVVVFRPSDHLDWDWAPRDARVPSAARRRDTVVFDAGAALSMLHPGVDAQGRVWLHPGFGVARALGSDGQLAAVASSIGDVLPVEHYLGCRRSPPPQPIPPPAQHATAGTSVPCPAILTGADRCVAAGDLVVRTGRVVAADPLVELDSCPVAVDVPIGRHPVTLALVDGDVGRAVVVFGGAPPVRWIRASSTAGGPSVSAVDSGTWGYADLFAADRLLLGGEDRGLADRVIAGRAAAPSVTIDVDGADLLAFGSGAGDGVYGNWLGLAADGRPVALTTDFGLDDRLPKLE